MKKLLLILFLLIVSLICNSQNYSTKNEDIDIKAFQIDNEPIKKITKNSFLIDSINVESKKFGNKIEIVSRFDNYEGFLITELYYIDDLIILIRFTEDSRDDIYGEYLAKINEYFYENGNLFDHRFSIRLTSHAMCLGIPTEFEWYENYGFNKNLSEKFLKDFAESLIDKF